MSVGPARGRPLTLSDEADHVVRRPPGPLPPWSALGLALSGCAATSTAVAKRNLDVQTKMSDTIFLDPVTPDERTVYVDVRNTSDQPGLDIGAAGPPGGRGARLQGGRRPQAPPASCSRPTCCRPGAASETAAEVGLQFAASAARCWAVPPAAPPATAWAQAGIGVNDAMGTIVGALAGAAISSVWPTPTSRTPPTPSSPTSRSPSGLPGHGDQPERAGQPEARAPRARVTQ